MTLSSDETGAPETLLECGATASGEQRGAGAGRERWMSNETALPPQGSGREEPIVQEGAFLLSAAVSSTSRESSTLREWVSGPGPWCESSSKDITVWGLPRPAGAGRTQDSKQGIEGGPQAPVCDSWYLPPEVRDDQAGEA